MELDAYQRCVGGADKKIKFCCGKEIVGDLNKIFAALGADQRAAALDHVNRAIAKYGDKDCLLATKASALIQLNEHEQAKAIVETLLERNPQNPVALGQKTSLLAIEDKVEESVRCLQQAMELYDRTISRGVLNAIRIVGALLQGHGHVVAARAHLMLYNMLAGDPDPDVARLLMSTFADPKTPVFLKYDQELPAAPQESGWATTYNQIRQSAQRGRWLSSLTKLRDLDQEHPNQPILRKAIAILESRVGSNASMAAAWRHYAETPGLPQQDAIEAEATAQVLLNDLLDETESEQKLLTFPITDVEKSMEALSAHPRAEIIRQAVMVDPDQPPPKIAYVLLDRPKLESFEGIQHSDIPNVIGSIMVYGKQTDRGARVEIEGWTGLGLEDAVELVREILPESLGEPENETTLGSELAMSIRMGVRWFLNDRLDPDLQRQFLRQQFVDFHTQIWPDLPLSRFNGQTARQAAQDPANHVALLAWLMNTEESLDTTTFDPVDLNPLRESLGLPRRESLDPTQVNLDRLPLCRFSRLDFDKLSDEQVERVMHIGRIAGHSYALLRAVQIRLARAKELDPNEELDLRMLIAFLDPNLQTGLEQFQHLERLAEAAEAPTSSVLLTKLDWCLSHGALPQAEETANRLQRRHLSEPGVAQRFAQLLVQHGVIDPRDLERGAMPEMAAPPEAAPSNLWTPQAETATRTTTSEPPAEEGKSKLWLPGMD